MQFFTFRSKEKGSSESEKRKILAKQVSELVKDLNYLNKDSIESLGDPNQFGTLPSSIELQQLKDLLIQSNKEELPEVLDNWLIDHESLISLTAHFPDPSLGEEEKTKYFDQMLVSYKEKMRHVKELTGGWFQKEKLDLLYSDANGGEAFDKRINELEDSLKNLSTEDKSEVIYRFFESLRE